MIYLLLAIISSALVTIIMRLCENRIKNNISLLSMNYIMCIIFAGFYSGFDKLIPHGAGSGGAIGMGLLNGIFYLSGFVLLQMNVRANGVVLTTTFMKLGVLVPTVVAILCFGEVPTALQIVGFIIAVTAIILIHSHKEQSDITFKIGLVLVLLAGGSGDAMSKVFEELGRAEFEENFLLYTFLSAFILSVLFAVKKGQSLAKEEVFWGLLIGIPNYYSARFLLKALGSIPAIVAYPTYSVATIVVVSIVGIVAFHEKVDRTRKIAIGMILAALVMLNI